MNNKQYLIKYVNKGRLKQSEMYRILGGTDARPCKGDNHQYLVECYTLHGTCRPEFGWCTDINDPRRMRYHCDPFKGDITCSDTYRPIAY